MKKYFVGMLVGLVLVIGFTGCGGGDSGGNETTDSTDNGATTEQTIGTTVTGQFIDEPVQGLSYVCSSGLSGVTNANGDYTCNIDDEVTFSIGSATIGTVMADSGIITPYSFFPNNLDAALNLARLLQSIDGDDDASNGVIVLDDSKVPLLSADTDFKSTSFVRDVEQTLNIVLTNKETAKEHMNDSIVSAGEDAVALASYGYESILNYSELKNNPKKVFNYIKDVHEFLDDENHIYRLNNCSSDDNKEKCTTYMMHLASKSLYYFMEISENQDNLESLKDVDFRYTWDIFSTNVYEEYMGIHENIESTLSKLFNKGLIKVDYFDMSEVQEEDGENFADKLVQNIYNPTGDSDYYFPMTAYRVANLGKKDMNTFFTDIKNEVESTYIDKTQKQEIYAGLAQMAEDMEPYILSRAPKISYLDNDDDIKALLDGISQKTSDFMVSYFESDWKGNTYGAYSKEVLNFIGSKAVSYELAGLQAYEQISTVKDALDLAEGILDDTLLWLDRSSDKADIEGCSSKCGGSSETGRWFLRDNEFYLSQEIYNELNDLSKWKDEFTLLSTDAVVITYSWQTAGWGACTGSCGTNNGTQTIESVCKSSNGQTVSDGNCKDPKPTTTQSCTASECSSDLITKNGFTYGTIRSVETGRVWMDRNLGASQSCSALNDTACYGDYYQWGRNADGHEKPNSITGNTLATTINPGHSNFITRTYNHDWTNSDRDGSLRSASWNPCPSGFRVPTKFEFEEENIQNLNEAYINLKIPSSGLRYIDGDLRYNSKAFLNTSTNEPSWSRAWFTIIGTKSFIGSDPTRAFGRSVRCIKN